MLKGTVLLFAGIAISSSISLASSTGYYCFLKESDQNGEAIEGFNTQKKMPIASVSKLLTTWWGIKSRTGDYRFETRIHVTPVGKDLYDVHLEGSRDPYFGKESLHYVISELNKKGIKQVRNLTFDENFKFFWDIQSRYVVIGHYGLSSPSLETVRAQLQANPNLLTGYAATAKMAKEIYGLELMQKPVFKTKTIVGKNSTQFTKSLETQTYTMHSAKLISLVKEMNRNSNNHAANSMFEHFGGAELFNQYISQQLGFKADAIEFVNGSGDRLDTENGAKYNEANCEAVVRTVADLRKELVNQKMDLENAVSVVGGDLESTADNIYINDVTDLSVIAKTGTVNPAITLAGMVHTKKGAYYFAYNMKTDGSKADWSNARQKIGIELTKKMKELNGGAPIKYEQVRFLSFDKMSSLETTQATGLQ